MTTFTDLGLDPALLKALEGEGYTTPTPIQAKAIPSVMEGRDLLGTAQTGTGKTAAFALPILHRLNADRRPAPRRGARVLVLSPTRELSTQIADSFRTYGRHMGFTVSVVFGGVPHRPQREALARGVDILVATPGRLIDHLEERNVSLETTEILVLDEADQMLDMGFIRPIRQILSKLASRRQSLFFSATMPHEIGALAAEMLRNPVSVSVAPIAKTADRVEQKVIHVEAPRKKALLAELFADPALTRTLVFTRTKRGADRVARHLETSGVPVAAIHGNKSQAQRERALADFKAGKIRGLIATDIAARGIDIDLVTHVVNYELPNIPESYVHRIGRTARAGAEGIAISFCDGEERAYLRDIERLTRQQIPSEDRRGDTSLAADQRHSSGSGEGRTDGRYGGNGRSGSSHRNGSGRHSRRAGSEQSGRADRNDRLARSGGVRDERTDARTGGAPAVAGRTHAPDRNAGRLDAHRGGHRAGAPGSHDRELAPHGGRERGPRTFDDRSTHEPRRQHAPGNGHATRSEHRGNAGHGAGGASLANVAFMAKPRGPAPHRAEGHRTNVRHGGAGSSHSSGRPHDTEGRKDGTPHGQHRQEGRRRSHAGRPVTTR